MLVDSNREPETPKSRASKQSRIKLLKLFLLWIIGTTLIVAGTVMGHFTGLIGVFAGLMMILVPWDISKR